MFARYIPYRMPDKNEINTKTSQSTIRIYTHIYMKIKKTVIKFLTKHIYRHIPYNIGIRNVTFKLYEEEEFYTLLFVRLLQHWHYFNKPILMILQ